MSPLILSEPSTISMKQRKSICKYMSLTSIESVDAAALAVIDRDDDQLVIVPRLHDEGVDEHVVQTVEREAV